jgi:hypothetical protein
LTSDIFGRGFDSRRLHHFVFSSLAEFKRFSTVTLCLFG